MHVRSGLARFKLVLTATRSGLRVSPSVEDLPPADRSRARKALQGDLCGTLLIADRNGLENLREVLARIESDVPPRKPPLSPVRQIALGFLSAGAIILGLLIYAWLR